MDECTRSLLMTAARDADAAMLDISFLFASPLVVVDRSARNFLPPLDVHSDCGALREACHDADWGVKARFEVATRTSMQRSVVRGAV